MYIDITKYRPLKCTDRRIRRKAGAVHVLMMADITWRPWGTWSWLNTPSLSIISQVTKDT